MFRNIMRNELKIMCKVYEEQATYVPFSICAVMYIILSTNKVQNNVPTKS